MMCVRVYEVHILKKEDKQSLNVYFKTSKEMLSVRQNYVKV